MALLYGACSGNTTHPDLMIPFLQNASPSVSDADPRLAHLAGPAAPIRQVIAAHFLQGFAHVVEIGGHRLPITFFLTHQPESVLSVDPGTDAYEADTLNGRPCRVRHLARKFQDVEYDLAPRSYGLVLLGFSLRPLGLRPAMHDILFDLVDNAGIIVIDHPPANQRSAEQAAAILDRPGFRTEVSVDLTLSDAVIAGSPFARRRLAVLRPVT
jgi:hypothetical protein